MTWKGLLCHKTTNQPTNKTHWEKAWWELHKNALYCVEQILEKTPHKTATVQPLASHLTNNSSKTSKTYWVLLEKQGQKLMNNVLWWTPAHTSVSQPAKTYLPQLCADKRCSLENLPEVMEDRNEWCERVSANTVFLVQLHDDESFLIAHID